MINNDYYSLNFETSIRRILGDRGYGIAGTFGRDKTFRQWCRRCVPTIRKRIDGIETTTRHKMLLMSVLERLDEHLKPNNSASDKIVVVDLMLLAGLLLGYGGMNGEVTNELFYWQFFGQYLRTHPEWVEGRIKNWYDFQQDERLNILSARLKVYKILKEDGMSDTQIAQVFNTTEYQLKKLKKGL